MAVSAATTAGAAYMLGEVINQAYVDKSIERIALFSGFVVVIFLIKGASTYGHTVILEDLQRHRCRTISAGCLPS